MSDRVRESQPPLIDIPDQPYFRIGQVAHLLGVETHVLRFWESEFPQIQPTRAPSGRRIYHRQDVEILALIKHLLHHEGYTIAGARRRLERGGGEGGEAGKQAGQTPQDKARIIGELKDILKMLE